MAENSDPIVDNPSPERVAYAIGRMLGAEDFQAEQNYHRAGLARLTRMFGTGTVNGLSVSVLADKDPEKIEVRVNSGMAIDRAGRVIEVPAQVCIRLKKFLDAQNDSDLALSFKEASKALLADVFLSFVACDRGMTPALGVAEYDATDAFTADRTLDGFRMELVLRKDDPKLPVNAWDQAVPKGASGTAVLDAAKAFLLDPKSTPAAAQEYPPEYDKTAVFLARISVAGTSAGAGKRPSLDLTAITIDNTSRLFVYPPSLLARVIPLLAVNP